MGGRLPKEHEMIEDYDAHGVRFHYPDDWELSEQEAADCRVITVGSPETSFWSLSLYAPQVTPEELIQTAVKTFQEEYDDVDVYPVSDRLCGRESAGCDLEFVYLELINSVQMRAFRTDRLSAFVMSQGTDHELETAGEVLKAITSSLECPGDEVLLA
jgi:hypothetical protein